MVTVSARLAPECGQVDDFLDRQAACSSHSLNLGMAEAEPGMGVLAAILFMVVGAKSTMITRRRAEACVRPR
jgi:hypothetical protein